MSTSLLGSKVSGKESRGDNENQFRRVGSCKGHKPIPSVDAKMTQNKYFDYSAFIR